MSDNGTSKAYQVEELDLVDFIREHLMRGKKSFHYKYWQLERLTQMAVDSFHVQETLVETTGPIFICGDIHGQYSDLLEIFSVCGAPHKQRYLFLGDYVDRGKHSVEVIALLLAYKIQYPDHVFMLRGNHEFGHINKNYGFHDELTQRFGPETGEVLWDRFNSVFSYMPLAATIAGRILCMHGGISPRLKSLDDIRKLKKPIDSSYSPGLVQDLLWADPSPTANPNVQGYTRNEVRRCSFLFDEKALNIKMRLLNIELVVRGHQVAQYGVEAFANGKMLTVFSAPRYGPGNNNWAGVLHIDADLLINKIFFKPSGFELDNQLKAKDADSVMLK